MVNFAVFKYDSCHFYCSLFHFILVVLLLALFGLDRTDDVVGLTLLDEFELGYHSLDSSLLDHKQHVDVKHSEQEMNLGHWSVQHH